MKNSLGRKANITQKRLFLQGFREHRFFHSERHVSSQIIKQVPKLIQNGAPNRKNCDEECSQKLILETVSKNYPKMLPNWTQSGTPESLLQLPGSL